MVVLSLSFPKGKGAEGFTVQHTWKPSGFLNVPGEPKTGG